MVSWLRTTLVHIHQFPGEVPFLLNTKDISLFINILRALRSPEKSKILKEGRSPELKERSFDKFRARP
jgi:hypothetical protein